jgi:molybdenum cofactor synthesis domain-containing protein
MIRKMKREQRFYRKLTTLPDARALLLARFGGRPAPEDVAVREALGRVLAGPVKAARSVPAGHSAAMDGIAVRAATTFGARPEAPVTLAGPGAVPINTGAPLPDGADAVVMIEHVEEVAGGWAIAEAVYPWKNVRKAGEDVVRGEILLPARHRIRPFDQAALLAAGVLSVAVMRRPRVLIVPTGDEIVLPERAAEELPPGAVVEVNGQMLASMAAECGAEATIAAPAPDLPERIREAVAGGLAAGCDVVLVLAGSSAGSEDHTPDVLAAMGELLVHGVTIMPGKPTLVADVGGRPVIGIPGYPVSAAVAFRELVRPLLFAMAGASEPRPPHATAAAARKIPSRLGLEEHVRVILGRVGGRIVATPLPGGAGALTSLVRADGILRIPQESSGLAEGESAEAELLSPPEELDRRLLVIGSHDLTIDLLASLLRERTGGRMTISSTNVGSMGGLLALERGVCHLAGSHLLDPATGSYNRADVRRVLAGRDIALVTLVHRWQGFVVAPGNPLGIRGVGDLTRPGVTFVNRQAGSGTRVLLDHELAKAGIAAAAIAGYAAEEYTHMAVAMAVASGRAAAGLAVAAAAQALDLDFVPLARERYDLVMDAATLADERVQELLAIIRSARFRDAVLALGGYEVDETGVVQPE